MPEPREKHANLKCILSEVRVVGRAPTVVATMRTVAIVKSWILTMRRYERGRSLEFGNEDRELDAPEFRRDRSNIKSMSS